MLTQAPVLRAVLLNAAIVRRTGAAIALGAGDTTITWDAILYNDGNLWSAGAPTVFTIVRDGTYKAGGSFQTNNVNGNLSAKIQKNGVDAQVFAFGAADNNLARCFSGDIVCVAGDTLRLVVNAADTGTLLTAGVGETPAFWCYRKGHETWSASVSSSAIQSIPSNTPIAFDTEVSDTGGFWDIGNPARMTVSKLGLYRVNGQYTGAAGGNWTGSLRRQPANAGWARAFTNNVLAKTYTFDALFYLDPADYVEMWYEAGPVGNKTISAGATLQIQRVG
jgi:hypothetical protein